jgi:SAM-dependent methyltransferase
MAAPQQGPRDATALDAADWLDVRFAACQPEYEALLRAVGIRPGWRVLDVGCGGGSHLPLLAHAVGPTGHVAALDLEPGNLAAVRALLADRLLPCEVAPRQGTITALPYPAAAFDAVWCANVAQHLDDAALATALAECRRVVRPGGLVAVKDVDMALWRLAPADPLLIAALARADAARLARAGGAGGGVAAHRPHRQPLRPVERRLWADWLAHLAALAEARGLDPAGLAAWRAVADADAPEHPLHRPVGGTSRAADQIAALARMGWEQEHVSAPHYGMLTLIGYFRRRVPAPPAHTRCEQ